MSTRDEDKALIESYGGPAKLAEKLGWQKDGSVQRVQNWTTRGIPPAVKLQFPHIFLRKRKTSEQAAAPSASNKHKHRDKPS